MYYIIFVKLSFSDSAMISLVNNVNEQKLTVLLVWSLTNYSNWCLIFFP